MHITHTAGALLLALSFDTTAWARDAAVATAPALGARLQAQMSTVAGSADHPRTLQVSLDELHPTQPAIAHRTSLTK